MYLRIFSALALAGILAACAPKSDEPDGESIDCAIGPGADFSDVCTLEAITSGEFLIHHPDGTFRRFEVDPAGGHRVADGADPLVASYPFGGSEDIEFRVSDDRYKIPSTQLPERLVD